MTRTAPRTASGRLAGHAGAWAISAGSLEALKWVALVLMTVDHVNKYLLPEAIPALYALGRMAMPLFGFVLMQHLAGPGALAAGVHIRVMKRLALFALLATPAFVALVGGWPLNILFTLFVATLMVWLLERGGWKHRVLAAFAFLVGGALVEFWWPALLYCVSAWAFARRPGWSRLVPWALATALLGAINGNLAALAALPLIGAASQVAIAVPRRHGCSTSTTRRTSRSSPWCSA